MLEIIVKNWVFTLKNLIAKSLRLVIKIDSKNVKMHLSLSRNEKLLIGCNMQGKGLEIGASYSPVAPKKAGYQVEVLDHADADTLKLKYKGHKVDTTKIEDIDYIWSGEPLHELTGKEDYYDWIIASHVIEHTPDMVSFLKQCEIMLKPGGILCLAVPDHRYCFDIFRPQNTPGDIIQAYHEKRQKHTLGAIWDHFSMTAKKGDIVAWEKGHPGSYMLIHQSLDDARSMLNNAQKSNDYIDVHNWRFTPSSFKLIMMDIWTLGYTTLTINSFFDTKGCEFIVQLQKDMPVTSSSTSISNRNDLLLNMLNESTSDR